MSVHPDAAAYMSLDQSSTYYDERLSSLLAARVDVLALVQSIGAWLTSTNDSVRYRATLLLSQISENSSEALNDNSQQHLASFFSSRLSDWPCQIAALQGCLALAKAKAEAVPAGLANAAAVVPQFLSEVTVQHLKQADRVTALTLLRHFLQLYGLELLQGEIPVIDAVIAAVDGERDPRCLLLAFDCIRLTAVQHSNAGPEASQKMDTQAEELCDVLACYFPITFTPPPDDVRGVTREDLHAALQATMACTEAFAPHILPLILEKLTSSLRQAKLDALAALAACAGGWGGHALAGRCNLQALWEGLRTEMLAQPDPMADDDSGAVPAAARAALMACLAALDAAEQPALLQLVLQDRRLADMFQLLMESASGHVEHLAAAIQSRSSILTAVVGSSHAGMEQTCTIFIPKLLGCLEQDISSMPPTATTSLALAVLVDVVSALQQRLSTPASAIAASDSHMLQPWTARLLAACMRPPLCPITASSPAAAAAERLASTMTLQQPDSPDGGDDLDVQQSIGLHQVQLLGALAGFPADAAPLTGSQQAAVLQVLLAQYGRDAASCRAATAALLRMAGSKHTQLLATTAVPQLLDTLQSLPEQARKPILDALAALAHAGPYLCPAILAELTSVLVNSQHPGLQLMIAECLADSILPACSRGPQLTPAAADSASQSALSLLKAERTSATPELALATARVVGEATAACTPSLQGAIADQAHCIFLSGQDSAGHAGQVSWSSHALAAAAALAALRPAAAMHIYTWDLLQPVLHLALLQNAHAELSLACSVAAASLLNKWPAGAATSLDDVAALAESRAEQAINSPSQAILVHGVQCLAWLARGLFMRGAVSTRALASLLSPLARDTPSVQLTSTQRTQGASTDGQHAGKKSSAGQLAADVSGSGSQRVTAIARAYGIIVNTSPASGCCKLSKDHHAQVRLLWQQRTFTAALAEIMKQLGPEWQQQVSQKAALLLALAHLLHAVPQALYRDKLALLLPLLVASLTALAEGTVASADAVVALLRVLAYSVVDSKVRSLVETYVDALLPVAAQLVQGQSLPTVRLEALSFLQASMALPYTLLHQHRSALLQSITTALDDPKRAVRTAAVQCRHAWATK